MVQLRSSIGLVVLNVGALPLLFPHWLHTRWFWFVVERWLMQRKWWLLLSFVCLIAIWAFRWFWERAGRKATWGWKILAVLVGSPSGAWLLTPPTLWALYITLEGLHIHREFDIVIVLVTLWCT